MESIKYIIGNVPKFFKWLILTVFVAPILVYLVTQYFTGQLIKLSLENVLILLIIVFLTLLGAFILGSIRSVSRLRKVNKEETQIIQNIDNRKQELELLPYSDVKIGELKSEHLNVDILGKIVLNDKVKPDISLFLKRVNIDRPYCPICSRPLDMWRGSYLVDGVQIGYKCERCNTQIKGDKYSVLNDAKAIVRKYYGQFWGKYKNEINNLTEGQPEKYKLL